MKSILDELWYGNICPESNSEEMKQLMKYMARHHDSLMATMTDEQKDIFERFDDCCGEYASLAEKSIFIYAFRLGARVAFEILGVEE